MKPNDSILRRTLAANGLFSMVTGGVSLVFADAIADFMEIHALIIRFIGAGVLIFGITIFWFSRHEKIEPGFGWFTTAADLAWVGGSVAVMFAFTDEVSSGGIALVGVLALAVLVFAIGQYVGLRRVSQ